MSKMVSMSAAEFGKMLRDAFHDGYAVGRWLDIETGVGRQLIENSLVWEHSRTLDKLSQTTARVHNG